MTIIPGERYPSEQLAKVGDCFKAKELAEKKAQDEANAKANEAKLAAEKAEHMTEDQAKAYAYGYLFDHYLTLLHTEIQR